MQQVPVGGVGGYFIPSLESDLSPPTARALTPLEGKG